MSFDDYNKYATPVQNMGELQETPTEFTLLRRLRDIEVALELTNEASVDTGIATGGSQTTVVDTAKSWETNCWKNALIEVIVDDVHYLRFAASNTDTTITIAALPAGKAVAAGDSYQCKIPVHVTDIERWGGTTLTGRDISLDLKALIDDSIKGVLKTLGDIATGENLVTRVGETDDAVVDAGAVGSMAAKLRRLTTDLGALVTAMGEVAASPTENTLLERQKALETAILATNTLIGEIQASPTENSVLERLLAVETAIVTTLRGASVKDLTTVETAIAAVETATLALRTASTLDTIETEVTAVETAVLALRTASTLDTLETAIAAVETAVLALRTASTLDTIETEVTAVETAVLALRTASTLDTVEAAIAALQGASSKDLTTVETAIAAIETAVLALRTASTLDTVETEVTAVETAVLALRTASTLDTLETAVAAVETAVLALRTASTLDTLETAVAAVETDVEATNTLIGEVQATPTSNTILARLKDLLTGIVLNTGAAIIGQVGIDQTTPGTTNAVRDSFGGGVYEKEDTAVVDGARRFETSEKKLRDVVIQVATYAQLFGDSSNQRYRVEAGETLGFTKVDISTLYFKNASAGQNGVVNILAVEE